MEIVLRGLTNSKTQPSLRVVQSEKGRGVVANEPISKGDFVIEYKTKEVYRLRQRAAHMKEYDMNGEGSYILEIQTSDGKWCLDATRRMDSLGRLMNHSVCPSLKPFKPLFVNRVVPIPQFAYTADTQYH